LSTRAALTARRRRGSRPRMVTGSSWWNGRPDIPTASPQQTSPEVVPVSGAGPRSRLVKHAPAALRAPWRQQRRSRGSSPPVPPRPSFTTGISGCIHSACDDLHDAAPARQAARTNAASDSWRSLPKSTVSMPVEKLDRALQRSESGARVRGAVRSVAIGGRLDLLTADAFVLPATGGPCRYGGDSTLGERTGEWTASFRVRAVPSAGSFANGGSKCATGLACRGP